MSPNVRKILYCADLTETSGGVFAYAVYLAKQTGAEIHILHVVAKLSPDQFITLELNIVDKGAFHNILAERINRSRKKLEKNLESFWAQQQDAETLKIKQVVSLEVCEGYPAAEILKRVEKRKYDLIVMGAHAKGLTDSFVGGVTKSVLNRSRIPTVVVPVARQ